MKESVSNNATNKNELAPNSQLFEKFYPGADHDQCNSMERSGDNEFTDLHAP
jgi:hypothetical protein